MRASDESKGTVLALKPCRADSSDAFFIGENAMNELEVFANGMAKMMTAKQIAEATGYQPDTIQKVAKMLEADGIIDRISIRPDSSHALMFDETQVQIIKNNLVPRTLELKSVVENAVTSLDIERMTLQVIQYHASKVKELETALAIAGPKAESHDAMMRSDKTMSITQCAKHFGVHPKTAVFPYLRERGYLTSKDLPSQAALDADILALVETRDRYTDAIYPQSVVRVCQLEKWRTVVIPNIEKWKDE